MWFPRKISSSKNLSAISLILQCNLSSKIDNSSAGHEIYSFMEYEGSSPVSTKATNGHYPELHESSPIFTVYKYCSKIHLNIILPSTPLSPEWYHPLTFAI
jgi:hypothetical protein